jgi:hypothetical protein
MLSSSINLHQNQSIASPERRRSSNQFGMNNHSVKVTVNNTVVLGTLMLSDEIWAFSSNDAAFLSVFPTGMTYSFSQVAPGDTYTRVWKHAIAAEAEGLMSATA